MFCSGLNSLQNSWKKLKGPYIVWHHLVSALSYLYSTTATSHKEMASTQTNKKINKHTNIDYLPWNSTTMNSSDPPGAYYFNPQIYDLEDTNVHWALARQVQRAFFTKKWCQHKQTNKQTLISCLETPQPWIQVIPPRAYYFNRQIYDLEDINVHRALARQVQRAFFTKNWHKSLFIGR